MKLTYEITDDPDRPGYVITRTCLEDSEPLIDVKLSVPAEIVASQFGAVAHTLKRWWYKRQGWTLAESQEFKTLTELTSEEK